jgi:hypothetical protein
MGLKKILPAFFILPLFFAFACGNSKKTDKSVDTATLGDTFSAASDAISDSTGGLNDNFASGSPAALNIKAPKDFHVPISLKERLFTMFSNFNIGSAAWAVPPKWYYYPTITNTGFSASSVDVFKNFTAGILGSDGTTTQVFSQRTSTSKFHITGLAFLRWTNLNSGAIQNTTQLQQAPHKTYTNSVSGKYITVDGASTTTISCTASGAPGGSLPVAHTILWSSGSDSTVSIDLIRKAYSSTGTLLSSHSVTTPSSLSMTVTGSSRTINSGTVQVYHILADYYTTFTFSSVAFNIYTGDPQSGTITVSITKDGSVVGTGTITYGSGTESYSFTVNGDTTTGTVDL